MKKLILTVFTTPAGEMLLKEFEHHFIWNRSFTDHRYVNFGFENEGAASVIRGIRSELNKEILRHE